MKVLSEKLDREKIESVEVTVAVVDLNANQTFGVQRETGKWQFHKIDRLIIDCYTAQLIISLIDVNDEKPIFQDSLDLVFEVVESQENAPIGQVNTNLSTWRSDRQICGMISLRKKNRFKSNICYKTVSYKISNWSNLKKKVF